MDLDFVFADSELAPRRPQDLAGDDRLVLRWAAACVVDPAGAARGYARGLSLVLEGVTGVAGPVGLEGLGADAATAFGRVRDGQLEREGQVFKRLPLTWRSDQPVRLTLHFGQDLSLHLAARRACWQCADPVELLEDLSC